MNTFKDIALYFTERARDAQSLMVHHCLNVVKAVLENNQMAAMKAMIDIIKAQDNEISEQETRLQESFNENYNVEEDLERKRDEVDDLKNKINTLKRRIDEFEMGYAAIRSNRDQPHLAIILENEQLKLKIAELEASKSE